MKTALFAKSSTSRFVLFYLLLSGIGLTLLDVFAPATVIAQFCLLLAHISGGVIHWFDPNVLVIGDVLRLPDSGFALRVSGECTALQFTVLLVAGMLAFPATWKIKLLGIVGGILALQALNIIRLISLLYLGQWYPAEFDWVHHHLWPIFFSIDLGLLFFGWIWWSSMKTTDNIL
ncbi:exosortase H [Candidatus Venteria ishoeyi]|uniref:exosortase H n=1 Tax=Candidatus Venteria ishoeyi TaxID=1899563 RepID=UPI0025A657AF|nr:exosortase H [Candidatus Venteria ishoeyi]MDM8545312.1 exosortase H [Candidatus Venteria ishoeyi]